MSKRMSPKGAGPIGRTARAGQTATPLETAPPGELAPPGAPESRTPAQSSESESAPGEEARRFCGIGLPALISADALAPMLGPNSEYAVRFFNELLSKLAPRDPIEEMLATQMILSHLRALNLTRQAARAVHLEPQRVLHECADRASNTYRKLMLALAEHRRPARSTGTGECVTVVQQANIANQQVVQNHVQAARSQENATNEQGCGQAIPISRAGRPKPSEAPDVPRASSAALPAKPRGIAVAAEFCSTGEAVGTVNRSAKRRGKGRGANECSEAR